MYILIINVMEEIKEMIKKKSNKKGFTIMEMLIVVAIIVVLAAIAIPTFSGALTKSKEATDVANIRAAYAEMQVKILTEDEAVPTDENTAKTAFYNPDENKSKNAVYTYTYDTNKKIATVKYKATKLTGGNDKTDTAGKTFTWTLSPVDIN